MAAVDYEARRKATWMRIKTMHTILCDEVAHLILERVRKHVDSFVSCEREYFILPDLEGICTDILVERGGLSFNCKIDKCIVHPLLTFKGSDGLPWRHLNKFATFGITTPVIEHLINFGKENRLTIFNISDQAVSSKILLQVVLKPNVPTPIPNPNRINRKRPRIESPSYSPTSPAYVPR